MNSCNSYRNKKIKKNNLLFGRIQNLQKMKKNKSRKYFGIKIKKKKFTQKRISINWRQFFKNNYNEYTFVTCVNICCFFLSICKS